MLTTGEAERLTFPVDYFQDEVRDGFYVSSMMKTVWAAELQMLSDLRRFMEKYGLRWFVDYGSLLGTVRHGGFIPWDDDLDITLPRKDYMTLLSHADELPEPYRIISLYHSDSFYQVHSIFKNTREAKLEWNEERMERFHGCPFILDIDLFPLDFVPRDPEAYRVTKAIYTISYQLLHKCVDLEERERRDGSVPEGERERFLEELEGLRRSLREVYGGRIRMEEALPLRKALCRVTDAIAMSCPEEEADEVDYFMHMASGHPLLRRKEWYAAAVELPYENTTVNVPVAYTAVLKKRFGPNYLQYVRGAAAHGYPFFTRQEEYLRFIGRLR